MSVFFYHGFVLLSFPASAAVPAFSCHIPRKPYEIDPSPHDELVVAPCAIDLVEEPSRELRSTSTVHMFCVFYPGCFCSLRLHSPRCLLLCHRCCAIFRATVEPPFLPPFCDRFNATICDAAFLYYRFCATAFVAPLLYHFFCGTALCHRRADILVTARRDRLDPPSESC